ncbi:MerR family transcriptional regulator [Candidatus Clostridium stratigraminis]|uniref:MerR family transcriptional regulator n=1 Tax=Candidatus Clostridium stratigraminis TaxID=3381661 RepID=A0ABW8T6E2_9CLOT
MRTYSTSEIARIIWIHPNTVMLYEKWGCIVHVPRSKNGYRVYGEDEIKLLKVIKALRQENYSTQCIVRMLKKLKTISKENKMFLSKEAEESNDGLLSPLSEVESEVKELIDYIGELINKKQNFKAVQL